MVRTLDVDRRAAVLTTADIESDSWIYVPTITTNSVATNLQSLRYYQGA